MKELYTYNLITLLLLYKSMTCMRLVGDKSHLTVPKPYHLLQHLTLNRARAQNRLITRIKTSITTIMTSLPYSYLCTQILQFR